MREVPVIAFLALILVPVLAVVALARLRSDERARTIAGLFALVTLVNAVGLVAFQYTDPAHPVIGGAVPLGDVSLLHFAIDGLSGPLLVLVTLLTLAFIVGSPRSAMSLRDVRSLLWLEALTITTLATDDLALLCVVWTLLVFPLDRLTSGSKDTSERVIVRRVFRLYHSIGLVCFAAGVLGISFWSESDTLLGTRVLHINASAMPERLRPFVFGALAFATMLRMGVAPLHSWLPISLEHGTSSVPAALVAMRTGLYVLVRLAIPAFPEVAHDAMPVLTAIAFCSAIYGAFAALGQRDLRRMLGFFIVSQSGIMLAGVAFGDPTAVGGALLYWLGFATSTTGLVLMISALEARTGTADMLRSGGIVRRAPALTACFFLFGLASIAIPGTVAFVAEDMLVHGALHQHPLLTLAMIAAMVLNAITFVRAFGLTFLGEPRAATRAGTVEDLLPRERVTALVLLATLVMAGVLPGPLVAAQASAAHSIASGERWSLH